MGLYSWLIRGSDDIYWVVNGYRLLVLFHNVQYYTYDVTSVMRAFGMDIWAGTHVSALYCYKVLASSVCRVPFDSAHS